MNTFQIAAAQTAASPKGCRNCFYRDGISLGSARCMLSGFSCIIERRLPTKCGAEFEGWQPRHHTDSVVEAIRDRILQANSPQPHNSSAEGAFCRASGSSPEIQAEDSISHLEALFRKQCSDLERDWKILVWSAVITAAVAMWLVIYHPAVFAVAFCIALSAATIVGIYCWAANRGNTEIGVSDTQGRDTTNTNS